MRAEVSAQDRPTEASGFGRAVSFFIFQEN